MKNLTHLIVNGENFNINTPRKVTWDSTSNMNDFKTPGVYEIYGERTRQDDNMPILNASSGHSIAARLTVVASTLQPANNEICITQFLMLSNRLGGEGNMYVRTYNENNSPAADWWTPWQKLQGIREGYIFTGDSQVNPDGGVQQIEGVTGLNNMIDNGIYSGIYTDDPTFQSPTFIDTFTLIVINNYAVAGKSDGQLKRTISQLKYAVDAITNQTTIKQRSKTDGEDWTDWKEIGGGGSNEVDITQDVLNAQGFYNLVSYLIDNGLYNAYFKKDNIYTFNVGTYIADAGKGINSMYNYLDKNNKIYNHFEMDKWSEHLDSDKASVQIIPVSHPYCFGENEPNYSYEVTVKGSRLSKDNGITVCKYIIGTDVDTVDLISESSTLTL